MANLSSDEFQGWETYPQNLGISPLQTDTLQADNRLSSLTEDLFVDKEESSFEYLDLGIVKADGTRDVQWDAIETTEDLHAVFNRSYTSSIFLISQSYTWSRLLVCEEHFRKLFTKLRVNPDFLYIVRIFCEKIGPVEESLNHFFVNISRKSQTSFNVHQTNGYELGYNIKYVAPHGREYPKDPFTIREVGVYQRYDSNTQQCGWVFLQASEGLKERLSSVFQRANETEPTSQFPLHAMIVLCVSDCWRDYLVYLEEQFSKLVDRGFFTSTNRPKLENDISADFGDIRRVQILTDKLRRLVQILQLNIRLGQQLKISADKIKKVSSVESHATFDDLDLKLDQFIYQQTTHLSRIETLIGRAEGISQLIQNILDIRATEASKQINSEMKKLTHQSTQDTRSMMTIALISAIFLPATFLATLFGSNFFGYIQDDNQLKIASNFWVYVVTAVGFSGATVVLWYISRRRKARLSANGDV